MDAEVARLEILYTVSCPHSHFFSKLEDKLPPIYTVVCFVIKWWHIPVRGRRQQPRVNQVKVTAMASAASMLQATMKRVLPWRVLQVRACIYAK